MNRAEQLYQEYQTEYPEYDHNRQFGFRRRVVNLAQRMKGDEPGVDKLQEIATALKLDLAFRSEPAEKLLETLTAPVWRLQLVRDPNSPASSRAQVVCQDDAARLLRPGLEVLDREHFVVMLLDTKHRVIGFNTVAIGTIDSALISPRETFKPALLSNASAIIVAHNHPSGDPTPSPEDIAVTRNIVEAGKILGVEVLDHLIIGEERFVSLKERGLM